jgi:hypothetical protein
MPLNRNATERERLERPDADLPDGRETDWARFVDAIEQLLATGQYTWALETLKGIQATVLRTQAVTPRQRRAVWSIEAGNRWRGRRR